MKTKSIKKSKPKLERAIATLAKALLNDVFDEAQWYNKEERGIGEPDVMQSKSDVRDWLLDRSAEIGELVQNEALRMLRAAPMSEVRKRIRSSK